MPEQDPRLIIGQLITNERHLWEILEPPEEQNGACFAKNLRTGYTLWLTEETISHCRVVIPEPNFASLEAA